MSTLGRWKGGVHEDAHGQTPMLVSEEVNGRAQQENMMEFGCCCVRIMWEVSTQSPWALCPQHTEDTESGDQLRRAGALRTKSKTSLQENSSSSFHFLILHFYFFFLKQKYSFPHGQATAGSSVASLLAGTMSPKVNPMAVLWVGVLPVPPSTEQLPPGLGTRGCPPARPHASTRGSGAGGTPPSSSSAF